MRANTPKRAKEMRRYRFARVLFLNEHPACETPWDCGRAASQVHHRRGRVGADLLREDLWLAVCGPCHERITVNPAEAYELGLSLRRVGAA